MKLTYILIPIVIFLIIYLIVVHNIQKNNNSNIENFSTKTIDLFESLTKLPSYTSIENNNTNEQHNEIQNIADINFDNKLDKLDNLDKVIKKDEECKIDDTKKCDTKTCGIDNLHPILDPKFNMREASKQCLLLEDHLNNKKKRCYDCIRKHFLTIDALLEEAVSLEKDNVEREYYRNLYLDWIKIEKKYAINSKDDHNIDDVSKQVRLFRKPLVEQYFDTISEYSE